MELETFLVRNREAILGRWFDVIIGTYPRVTSEFLAKQDDQFRNPVGHAIAASIGPVYDQIVGAMDADELLNALDRIIRIRSVQEFTPSEAVGFVFELKTVIRNALDGGISPAGRRDDLAELEARIDRVALLGFEKYTECREKLFQIRKREIERRTMKLLERVNARRAVPEHGEVRFDDDA